MEMRRGEPELRRAVGKLNHLPSQMAVEAERAVLSGLESGCQVPVGVWARGENGNLRIDACVLSADGSEAIRETLTGSPENANRLGHSMSASLLARGADRLLRPAERGVEHR
jgi:hydroxymethylbilane synthase